MKTKRKLNRKAILMLSIALLLLAAVTVGTTFAKYTKELNQLKIDEKSVTIDTSSFNH